MTTEQAVIVGGGTMGADIAVIFAAGEWKTDIVESSETVRNDLPARLRSGLRTLRGPGHESGLDAGYDRFRICADLDEIPWDSVALVVECVPEDLGIKRAVFERLERLSPAETLLTSNSSSIPISRIGQGLASQSRMAGLHFFMPAHLVPLVEVVRSEHTDPGVTEKLGRIMRSLGKRPVQVGRDIPGFLANRLQHALMREVLYLVEKGIATIEDIDAAVRYGFGFRFLAAGPLLQKDLSGIDIHCAAAYGIYPDLCNASGPCKTVTEMVAAGHTGAKAQRGFYTWTDEGLKEVKGRYQEALLAALEILKKEI
ncbi:MAG: 3-hydroxyacyl-CoA dehydrogenase [Desulfobacteraceae bacterium]|nr:MAG: 3-hydroxyacyl-CoA dehydrogenase [Desulfobacteraceae bacterium]